MAGLDLGQFFTVRSFVLVVVVYVFTRLIYNAFFHPLSKVPGPLFARVSGIPSWYRAMKGDRHIWLWQLFQIYGDRIRVGPNTVLFCDPDAYKDIYNTKANVQRSGFYTAWRRNEKDAHTLNTVDVAEHAYKRKLLNVSFTEKSVRAASDFIFRHIDRWNELMIGDSEDWSNPIDFSESVGTLVFDISGDLCFGKSFETKEPGENPLKAMPQTIEQYMRFYYPIARSPFLDFVLWLKPRGLDSLFEAIAPPSIKYFNKFVYDCVSKRLILQQELNEKPGAEQRLDMFHFLCEAKDPDTGRPAHDEQTLRAEASLLVIAGSDTSATSLTATMFYLSLPSQAHRLAKVVREIRSMFQSAEEIVHGPKLASCVYMKACIEEAMRLSPAGPSELPRQVRAGGITIKGYYYPEGTIVGTSGFANGRNEQVYGDSYTYRPERWIVDEAAGVTQQDVDRARSNFHPFSLGPGNCVGKNLAMLELLAAVGRTLWRYDMRRAPGSTLGGGSPELGWGQRDPDQFHLVDAYVALHHGPMLQFRKRQI
ncbi:benzoate 4-monooxygenase cytochrome P450 [Lindgomyces ingoldianus]|uniref:Benzoate 4-monooxygenase cytochrome P450 n=1 Tax=Lindgomyces ingoldianus TaxID=673940 RepID=A0ACB6QQD4_9PLEO|nr:benzoate 4-monooxygenase cytochrome P450 [Lindgomyces ingoldianus]KAF2469067.1 benzoate 4-monooxygenase cytochrome P450 [Lindgomyces ingoldianus]